MALFNTIPVESETLLAKEQPKTTSMKRLVGGAAIASFVLGVVAATALSATSAPVPPAALHKEQTSDSGSIVNYVTYVACLNKKGVQQWSTDQSDYENKGVHFNAGSYPKWDNTKSWGDGFGDVEIQQFYLDNEWAWKCDTFGLSVKSPDGQGYRAYDSDGIYLGSKKDQDSVYIKNLNYGESEGDEGPEALKTSVFLENEDGTVQGESLLVVSINFKPTMPKPKGWHCIIDEDITSDGFNMKGHIKSSGKGCPLMPPTYYCGDDPYILYYQGSLNMMADGSPIDIEFKNGATLEVPINNLQFTYDLDRNNPKCAELCNWANQNKFSTGSINFDNDNCFADITMHSVNDAGLGQVKIYGNGVMSPNGVWDNARDNWPDWQDQGVKIGEGFNLLGGFDTGKGVLKINEWFMLGGIIDITQDNSKHFVKNGYGLQVRDITIANTMPRGDSAVNHQTCWRLSDKTKHKTCVDLASKGAGAMLKNINHVSWLAQADGPNLQARWSKIDTSYLQSADDVIHVSASNFNAYKNVVSTGSAGAAVILGSYNEGLNEQKIKDANVNGVFVARAMRTMNGDSEFKDGIGLVDTMTCIPSGYLDLTATVQNLQVAGLGPDVQQIDRLYSISSIDGSYGGCGGDNTALPRYEITLNGFDLQGGSASYPPRVCEYGNTKTGDFYFDDTTAIDWDNSCSYDW